MSPARKKKPVIPPVHDWRTTDEDEINRRRLRAREERFAIENLEPGFPVFGNFSVRSGSGQTYAVELRGLERGECACTCVDFRSNALGTCKHVEAVWLHLARRERPALAEARRLGNRRFEVIPDATRGTLRLLAARGQALPSVLREWFDSDGCLAATDPAAAVARLRGGVAARVPGLRVSQEVEPWLEVRGREADRVASRREYELKVQSGEWPLHETRVPLFPYQRDGMLHLAFTERALLADEMGLGKTIQAIAACALLRRLGRARRVLVVTPASLKAEWEEQIQRFTDLPVHLVYGGRHQRLPWLRSLAADPASAPFFVVMNYEQVVRDAAELNELLAPDVVILDEAQRIKNWNTQTAKRVKQLRSRYAFVLTGTPIENRIDELRSIVDFLDPTRLGPLFRFNREFYEMDARGRPAACRNLDVLHERVRPILLRRRKAEVETQLPPRTDRHLFVPLTDRQRETYAAHEQEVMRLANIAERRPLSEREQECLQRELAMMRMICDTNYILDSGDRECPKLAELEGILDDCLANGAKAIVFSEWERMLELVRDLCQRQHVGFAWHTGSVPQQHRRVQINRFKNDPDCRVFLTTDAGATGLNLQDASVVVNCDLPWNPARLEQRIARAWRKHQTRPVTVYHLIAEDTLEHRMLETLATKRSLAESVLDTPGTVTTVPLRSGRKAMVERVRALVGSPGPRETQSESAAGEANRGRPAAVRRDPAVDLAFEVRRKLGPALLACEERRPLDRAQSVLVFVVDGDAAALRPRIEREVAEARAASGGPDAVPARIEVLDRATHEAIGRLAEAGLLRFVGQDVRELLEPIAGSRPALTPEQRAAVAAHRTRAARGTRAARLLLESDLEDETDTPLRGAAMAWAVAAAIEQGRPEPAALEDVAKEAEAGGTPDLRATLGSFLRGEAGARRTLLEFLEAAFRSG